MFVTGKRKQLALDIFTQSARFGFYQLSVRQVYGHSLNFRGVDPDIGWLERTWAGCFPCYMGIDTVARVLRRLSDEGFLAKTEIPSTHPMDWPEDEKGFNPDSEIIYTYRLTGKKVRDRNPNNWAPQHLLERI